MEEILKDFYEKIKSEYEKQIGRNLSDEEFQELMKKQMEENKKKQIEEEKRKYREIICEIIKIPKIHAIKIINNTYEVDDLLKSCLKQITNIKTGKWLLISGSIGVGKSFTCSFILFKLYNILKEKVAYIQASEIDEFFNYKEYKILAIDDLGLEKEKKIIQRIVEHYYDSFKILILTTNINIDRLVNEYDARMMDRIIEKSIIIETEGKSKRWT